VVEDAGELVAAAEWLFRGTERLTGAAKAPRAEWLRKEFALPSEMPGIRGPIDFASFELLTCRR